VNQSLQFFSFKDQEIRVNFIDNSPYWVLADVCKPLDLGDPSRVADRLDPDGTTFSMVIDSLGREQKVLCINEPNLYRTIFRSNKPEAKVFQDWVFKEVLPAIRKTGSYSVNQEEQLRTNLGTMQFFGQAFKLLFKAISARDIVENKQLALGALSMLKHVRLLIYRAVRDYEALVRHFHGSGYDKSVGGDVAQFQIIVHNGELVAQLQFPFIEEAK
jgi:prophage antirepressor-like protein